MSEKLKPSDFRIGNRVNKGIINAIHKNSIQVKDKFGNLFYAFEPIPLTSEILLACGFVKCEGKFGEYFKCSKLDGFRIWLTEHNNYSWWSIGRKDYENDETIFIFKDCKYLHQLQNLYFALTNQELEFKTELLNGK